MLSRILERSFRRLKGAVSLLFVFSLITIGIPGQAKAADVAPFVPVSGTWSGDPASGIAGDSGADTNAFNMSTTTVGTNFIYEVDLKVDAGTPYGTASLVFRSNVNGSNGYVLSLDPNMDRLRLFNYGNGADVGTPYSTTLEPGVSYRVKVQADGPYIRAYLNENLAISTKDTVYAEGVIGLHSYNGKSYFSNIAVYEMETNLSGWTMFNGTWKTVSQGLNAASPPEQNAIAVSEIDAVNFTYEANLTIMDPYAVGSVLFRSNADGSQAYALQVDPNADRIRLYDSLGDRTLGTSEVALDTQTVYRVRIIAKGSVIEVFLADEQTPRITANDAAYSGGRAGLQVYNGGVVFQNVFLRELAESGTFYSNLADWTEIGGVWSEQIDGMKGVSSGGENASYISASTGEDFVLTADLKVDAGSPEGRAAVLLRSNSAGTSGYKVVLEPASDQVRLLKAGDGGELGIINMNVEPGKKYHFEIAAKGNSIQVMVDGSMAQTVSVTGGEAIQGLTGLSVQNGTAFFQNVYITAWDDYYSETYRPKYHFTPARGYASDPNGLVYYEGEYHLFYQDGGKWAHAVSTDMVNWKQLPIAIPWNEMGHAWSGSAVADLNDVSGLFNGESGLIAYYTSFNPAKWNGNQKIGVAFSKDKGRTWEFYDGNPIIPNIGGVDGDWDFRDPKVVWDESRSQWIMVVSGGDHIRFFTSQDLLNWSPIESFGYGDYLHNAGVWETPDFFQLPVDGDPNRKKWVLMISTGARPETNGSDSEYFVGEFDGTRFISDNPAPMVLRNEKGRDMYAATTFAGMEEDGRRIEIGWMSNWNYPFSFPTYPWKGQMSIPRELKLTDIPGEGIRLVQEPVTELNALRGPADSWSDVAVTPDGTNLLKDIFGTAFEIEAVIELPETDRATAFGFKLRALGDQQTIVGYRADESKLFVDRSASGRIDYTENLMLYQEAKLQPEDNRIKLRIYVDESSVEVFGNNGKAVFSNIILPDSARDGMSFYSEGGNVRVVSLNVYPLKSVWKNETFEGSTPAKVVMDRKELELAAGQTQTLYTAVLPTSAMNKKLNWSSSNPAVASVVRRDMRSADITGAGVGTAVITAVTETGGIAGSVTVEVGEFKTNLSGFSSFPRAQWVTTSDGIAGAFDKDANYMSDTRASNFTYEADLKLDEKGGAGSLIFRASPDGLNGYYFNVDPNLKLLRLFYKDNGYFQDNQVLAAVPTNVKAGQTYHAKIVANGTNIKVYFDGSSEPVMDVNDISYSSGYFGLNVFGGRAYYQNVYADVPASEDIPQYSIVSAGGQVLAASGKMNGSQVRVVDDLGAVEQRWFLVANEDGSYSVIGAGSNKALDASGSSDGSAVQIWRNFGFGNQRWYLEPGDDGTVSLKAVNSGKALEAVEGAAAVIREFDGSALQRWRVIKETEVPVESIEVFGEGGETAVTAGKTLQMKASVQPETATDPSVTWTVVNVDGTPTELAGIGPEGLLRAYQAGTVKVMAEGNDGSGIAGSTQIRIVPPPVVELGVITVAAIPKGNTAIAWIDGAIISEAPSIVKDGKLEVKVTGAAEAEEVRVLVFVPSLQDKPAGEIKSVRIETGLANAFIPIEDFKNQAKDGGQWILTVKRTDTNEYPDEIRKKIGERPAVMINWAYSENALTERSTRRTPVDIVIPVGRIEVERVIVYQLDQQGKLIVINGAKYNRGEGAVTFKAGDYGVFAWSAKGAD